jgi:phosphoesterase RecJ-like protein
MLLENKLQSAYQMIKAAKGILLISHLRPDGDALSSLCALKLIIDRLAINNWSFCEDKHPAVFDYLPGFYDVINDKSDLLKKLQTNSLITDKIDLIIVTDCGSLARTALGGEIKEWQKQGVKIIEIDHHPKVDEYADLEIRDESLSSSAELVFEFIHSNQINFDRLLADCVLTGVMSDTGNFLYPSASKRTMQIASMALSAGAAYAKILQAVAGDKNLLIMKLWGLVLERLQLNPRYSLATAVITRQDLTRLFVDYHLDSATEGELFSNLVSFLSNYAGAKAVMLLHEDGRGFVKGSLRSTADGYLVNRLARALGGGGHERAAGFAIEGQLIYNGNWQIVENKK